jgi:uncharacterized protein YkwD
MPNHLPHATVRTRAPRRRSLILPGILLVVFALSSIGATVAIANANASDSSPSAGTAARAASEEDRLSSAIGDLRQANGRGVLHFDAHLQASARAHATEMQRYGSFSHDSRNGDGFAARIASFGFNGPRRGENIEFEQGYDDVSAVTLAGWIASPEHHRILLDRGFSRGAVGISCSSPDRSATCYVVLDVGSAT